MSLFLQNELDKILLKEDKMSKPRKSDSRRPGKKKLEEKKNLEAAIKKLEEEEALYTRPASNSESAREECRQRLQEGKLCYCKERCHCRSCQERKKEAGREPCSLEALKNEGGCISGCSECSECNPCY